MLVITNTACCLAAKERKKECVSRRRTSTLDHYVASGLEKARSRLGKDTRQRGCHRIEMHLDDEGVARRGVDRCESRGSAEVRVVRHLGERTILHVAGSNIAVAAGIRDADVRLVGELVANRDRDVGRGLEDGDCVLVERVGREGRVVLRQQCEGRRGILLVNGDRTRVQRHGRGSRSGGEHLLDGRVHDIGLVLELERRDDPLARDVGVKELDHVAVAVEVETRVAIGACVHLIVLIHRDEQRASGEHLRRGNEAHEVGIGHRREAAGAAGGRARARSVGVRGARAGETRDYETRNQHST